MGLTLKEGLKIIALRERIGMPWEWHPNRDDSEFAWNGAALNVAHESPNGTSDVVHEIAHWLVAPAPMRKRDDFGLESTSIWETMEEARLAARDAADEEVCASLLGILIERHLGFDWRYTWEFHQWAAHEGKMGRGWSARPVVRKLQQRGLLRGLTPTCMPDATSARKSR